MSCSLMADIRYFHVDPTTAAALWSICLLVKLAKALPDTSCMLPRDILNVAAEAKGAYRLHSSLIEADFPVLYSCPFASSTSPSGVRMTLRRVAGRFV